MWDCRDTMSEAANEACTNYADVDRFGSIVKVWFDTVCMVS